MQSSIQLTDKKYKQKNISISRLSLFFWLLLMANVVVLLKLKEGKDGDYSHG